MPTLADLLDMGKQYFRDAMPGGNLNPEVTRQSLLDGAAIASSPVPVLGDLLGLGADVNRYVTDPESRTAGNFALSGLGMLPFVPAMTAWHGSPHKFDKFKAEAIGTGEGAQAYGHGLYLAENPGVANEYAAKLGKPEILFDGKRVDQLKVSDEAKNLARWVESRAGSMQYGSQGKTAREDFSRLPKAIQDELKSVDLFDGGNLYKTDIPDEAVARFLDWDKPLSQQAPEVQAALQNASLAKALGQVGSGDAYSLGNRAQRLSGPQQVGSGGNIPLDGVMGNGMRGVVDNRQVGSGVVGLDPVDMMNGLAGKQGAANGVGGSNPMQLQFSPTNGGNRIPLGVDASGSPVGGITSPALAENFGIGGDVVRMPENTLAAIRAGAFDKMSGQDIYSALRKELGSDDAASKALAQYNINGIRYLDGGSRSAGQGSSNFVVFSPDLIRILERNGQPTGQVPWKPGEWKPKGK